MKKLITLLSISAVLATSAFAGEFKTSGVFRTRAYATTSNSTFGDAQAFKRIADLRFRPGFEYKANENFSSKVVFEIGDLGFGNKNQGGGWDTDEKVLELKHASLNLKKDNHSLVLGLQGYKDAQGLIIQNDVAGASYNGTFDKLGLGIGWYAIIDDGETKKSDNKTYGFGQTLLTGDVSYKIDDKSKVGLSVITDMRKADSTSVNFNTTNLFIAPYYSGKFGAFSLDAEFVYNNRSYSYDIITSGTKRTDPDSENGLALSLLGQYQATNELNLGVNFLYESGDKDSKNGFENIFQSGKINGFYDTKLVILNTKYYFDDTFNVANGLINGNKRKGVILPALFADYKINNDIKIGANLGYGMTAADVERAEKYNDTEKKKFSSLGFEADLRGEIKVLEAATLVPYVGFLFPGEVLSTTYVGTTKGDKLAKDMIMSLGFTLEYKF